jgi:ribosome-associated protein
MIEITSTLCLDESELRLDFIRASGPGGQNVNKVSSAVQLHFDVGGSPSLTEEVKERLARLAGSRMTGEGVLVIEAKRYRSQEQNRLDAIHRLVVLVQKALEKPEIRKKTRPSFSARAARLNAKKHRGTIKRTRQGKASESDY